MTWDIQRSFAAGEISPALYGRTDVARYSTALRTCRNFIVRKEGGVKNRTGTQFIAEVKDSSTATRLIKFVFNDDQTYVCEFGAYYIRFFKNGAPVTVGSPAAWNSGTAYSARDLVSYSGINYYAKQASTNKNPSTETAYWYALTGSIYEIPTPYGSAELFGIKYEQSGDIITLTHPSVDVQQLDRYGDTSWSIASPAYVDDPFTSTNNYPSTVTYYQQRQVFASTNTDVEDIWLSKTGDFGDFTVGTAADSSFSFTIAGRGINQVQHLVGVGGKFVVLTTGGEWLIAGDSDGTLKPTAINARQHSYVGAGNQRPVVVDSNLLYVQNRGSTVRATSYDFARDSMVGRDMTVFSGHLFEGYTVAAMDFQQIFDSVLWCVRDDGVLLGLTFLPEQEMWGWHRHDTDGDFEDVCVVPEGVYDAMYVVVRRTINGNAKRYIERMADPFIADLDDAKFVDSWLDFDGTNTTADTITATQLTGWTSNDTVTLTASTSTFLVGDVGNAFVLTAGGETVSFKVTAYASGTSVTARPSKNVPVALQGVATSDWALAADVFSGMSHLEGKTVSILADGAVETQAVVTSGTVTLPRTVVKCTIGLPITADIELLDIENPSGLSLIDAKKQVSKVKLLVQSSRNVKASSDGGVTWDEAVPVREFENYGDPPDLKSGVIEVLLSAEWNDNGRVMIRQDEPLPLTILGAAPVYNVGKT